MSEPADAADEPGVDAATEALNRARAAARAKGLRVGSKPKGKRHPVTGRVESTDRDPSLLGDVVDRLVTDRGWERDVEVGGVIGRWAQIVGPALAEHARPETFDDGVLVVRAASTSWAVELRLLSGSLLARIAEETGPDVVTELQILGPTAPTWRHGRRGVTGGRGPRDTYG